MNDKRIKQAKFVLQVAIAFVFLYAAISGIITPDNWIGYFPRPIRDAVPQNILMAGFDIGQIIFGLWLLSGKFLRASSLIAVIGLLVITLGSLPAIDITFRDIGLAFAAYALFLLS